MLVESGFKNIMKLRESGAQRKIQIHHISKVIPRVGVVVDFKRGVFHSIKLQVVGSILKEHTVLRRATRTSLEPNN